jgi:hypothetical protein
MKEISWINIETLNDSEISYLLYKEGKDIKTICRIRGKERSEIEKHIIECKVKYRVFEGAGNADDIVKKLIRYTKEERINSLKLMPQDELKKIEKLAISKLFDCNRDECMFYIWLLGELESKDAVSSLVTFLKCSDGNIKRMCCSALGKIGDKRAENALVQCLDETRSQVKEYAIKALGKLKSSKALSKLREFSTSSIEKPYVVRAAIASLEQIEGKGEIND